MTEIFSIRISALLFSASVFHFWMNSWTSRDRVYPYNTVLANQGMMLSITSNSILSVSYLPTCTATATLECYYDENFASAIKAK